jgi:transcriptional regulator with XRE-family HTH domain
MDPVTVRFGRRVRRLRLNSGLTQEQLAKAAGLDAKHIGVIERGVKSSSFPAVARLANALQVDIHELFLPDNQQIPVSRRAKSAASKFRAVPRGELERFVHDVSARLQKLQGVKE